MDLSIFSKDELNFINIHIGLVIKDEEHLEECVEKYWNDLNITFWDTTNIKDMSSIFNNRFVSGFKYFSNILLTIFSFLLFYYE